MKTPISTLAEIILTKDPTAALPYVIKLRQHSELFANFPGEALVTELGLYLRKSDAQKDLQAFRRQLECSASLVGSLGLFDSHKRKRK